MRLQAVAMIQFDGEFGLGSVESMTKLESMIFDHQKKMNGYFITLNVGLNPRSSIISAPNEVI